MILKYQDGENFRIIDGISEVKHRSIDIDSCVSDYDRSYGAEYEKGKDPAEYMNGIQLSANIVKANKAFTVCAGEWDDEGVNGHSVNNLDENSLEYPTESITAFFTSKRGDYDAVQIITNHAAYLMNDSGQTIERLN
ncbi:MAG: hypothetical protein M0R51_12155 [Clostridia bacterium]|jgi:hypothetical protein|nr:hypothetical protein [Clostridia bacterium]